MAADVILALALFAALGLCAVLEHSHAKTLVTLERRHELERRRLEAALLRTAGQAPAAAAVLPPADDAPIVEPYKLRVAEDDDENVGGWAIVGV